MIRDATSERGRSSGRETEGLNLKNPLRRIEVAKVSFISSLVGKLGTIALIRLCTMAIGIVCNILMTRTLVSHVGLEGFSTIALISTLSILLPFADLGVGAALVNETVDYGLYSDRSRYVNSLTAALRVACLSAFVLVCAGSGVSLIFGWSSVLGAGAQELTHPNIAISALSVVIAVGIPLGLGARVLQGRGMIARVMVIQGMIPPLTLGLVLLLTLRSVPLELLSLCSPIAVTIAGGVVAWSAVRGVDIRRMDLLRARPTWATYRMVIAGGASFTVITLSLVVAFQTDRLILSHESVAIQIAIYSLIAPVYAAVMSVISMAGQLLWPHYRMQIAERMFSPAQLRKHILIFGSVGILAGFAAAVLLPIYAEVASRGLINVTWGLRLTLVALITAQALHLPSAYVLTDSNGFRFSAILSIPMAVLSVLLSVFLAPSTGATGVLLGSAAAVLTVQLLPTYFRATRHLRMCAN